jgi:hypothetical protein
MCRSDVAVNSTAVACVGISCLLSFLVLRRKRVWNGTNIISHKICSVNLKGIDHFENLDVYGSVILRLCVCLCVCVCERERGGRRV